MHTWEAGARSSDYTGHRTKEETLRRGNQPRSTGPCARSSRQPCKRGKAAESSIRPTTSEVVCASTSSATEGTATPKIIGSVKQDRWVLDKKNKQLTRAHSAVRTERREGMSNRSKISRERNTHLIGATKGTPDGEPVERQARLQI